MTDSVAALLAWSPWRPLRDCWLPGTVPDLPGLYRNRRVGRTDLDYLGQIGMGGMTLRKRLAMLRGVYADAMPYRDSHTAGPALWALCHRDGCDFEASVVPVDGPTSWRKGLEAVAFALYRQEHHRSPTVAFGRMPGGYVMSTANNAKLVAAGLRRRGGLSAVIDASHAPSLPPMGALDGPVTGPDWGGHVWSAWVDLPVGVAPLPVGALGIYRIRDAATPDRLLYIGEGNIADRLSAHGAKRLVPGHVQGAVFAAATRLQASWVVNQGWLRHQQLELETDLIRAHLLTTGVMPPAQFLG